VVLERGVRAATIAAIANASRAPTGSIYHRFESVQEVLARLWIRAVRRSQDAALPALGHEDPQAALVAASLAMYDFCFSHPDDARLLALFSRADFLSSELSGELHQELLVINERALRALRDLSRRLFGKGTGAEFDLVLAAVVDLPYGLARRYLESGARPPAIRRGALTTCVSAMLAERSP
jgi:AcrR family transcriptional regulator